MIQIRNQGTTDHYNLYTDVLPWIQPSESEMVQTNHTTEQDSTVICIDSQYSKTGTYFAVILHICKVWAAKLPGLKKLVFQDHTALWYTLNRLLQMLVLDRSCTIAENKQVELLFFFFPRAWRVSTAETDLAAAQNLLPCNGDVSPVSSSFIHLQYQCLKLQLFTLQKYHRTKSCDMKQSSWHSDMAVTQTVKVEEISNCLQSSNWIIDSK